MWNIGDMVIYGINGVCKIEKTEKQRIRGIETEYYVLVPVYDKDMAIYVPVHNQELLAKMHPVLSEEKIYEMIRSISSEKTEWISDDNQRKQAFQQIIQEGDRRKMLGMIRSLYLHKQEQEKKGRRLHQADEAVFKQAERLLYDEFALVLHLQQDEVLPFIIGQFGNQEQH